MPAPRIVDGTLASAEVELRLSAYIAPRAMTDFSRLLKKLRPIGRDALACAVQVHLVGLDHGGEIILDQVFLLEDRSFNVVFGWTALRPDVVERVSADRSAR
jgi:hypothetical protein